MSVVTRYLDPALLERLRTYQLSARSVVEGTTLGQHRSPVRGASVEFRQHRAYVPGDEPRRLDWRVLARTDRPYVREYHEETNLRCILLLDRSGSMAYAGRGRSGKFDYAAKIVASLAYLMLNAGESAGVATIGERVEQWLAPHAGTQQLARVIDVLERSTPGERSDLPRALHDVAQRIGRRSLVVIVSDLIVDVPPLRAALSRLRHARHEVILLRVLDDDEIEFPFNRWLRLRGLEGEGVRLCEPAIVREQYQSAFAAHKKALHDACQALDVELHTFATSRNVGDALAGFLKHRAG
jgi:uncharacterized protein (DUF58 family)